MNREILFRGKLTERFADVAKFRSDLTAQNVIKDGFVYGSLVACGDKCFICVSAYASNEYYVNNSDATMFEVDPETVGRYIGLTDRNRVKIFEGDIVKAFDCIYVVMWDSVRAMFYLRDHISRVTSDFYNYFGSDLVVIDNIHDNPELLKKESETT